MTAPLHRELAQKGQPVHVVAIGGSDAGISAALRARELDPSADVTVVVADAYPNFSICGIPYYISGEVTHWSNLAHRTHADLEATGMKLRLDTLATEIDVAGRRLALRDANGAESWLDYDELIVGTGAVPVRPPIGGLDDLGPADGVHLLHSMGDTFALTESLERIGPKTALIVGAGYVGLEMAEGLTARGIEVTQVEMLPEVLPTVDPELGRLVHAELERNGVAVHTESTVTSVARTESQAGRLHVEGVGPGGQPLDWRVDLVLVVVGVRPDTDLLIRAGARAGIQGAVEVDQTMATGLAHVWAAGDCVVTHHRLLGTTYLPLGTTAHKQGRIAGENALGGRARYAGSLGTQVVKVFDLVAARTGLREHEARGAGFEPVASHATPDDHKAYYPGAQPISIRVTGDAASGRLLGAQLVGARGTETAKRVDTYATALFHGMTVDGLAELDLSYTPPLGSPWDAVQMAAQGWVREYQLAAQQAALKHRDASMSGTKPRVLFVCGHNAGRSALGAALARAHGGDVIEVDSAGVAPAEEPSQATIASLAEIGIDDSAHRPSAVTEAKVRDADVVVAMKPGLELPEFAGARYVNWSFDDPAGRDADGMRPLREQIEARVKELIAEMVPRNSTP